MCNTLRYDISLLGIALIFGGALLAAGSAAATGWLVAPRTPLPRSVRFLTGAAVYSLSVFLLLTVHAGYTAVLALWAAFLALTGWQRSQLTLPLPASPLYYRLLFATYGAMYLVVALAPEIQEDAAGYHLRIVSDYVRLHAFSGRVTFYDALPHGFEMLFVPAFSIGGHSAAKLVHFAFLIALVPLVREIAREIGMADRAGSAAGALLFLAPVCGVAGSSAYTDMGLVCACCAVLYLLLRWKRERAAPLLICAGLNAGFCFAIKPSFGIVAVAAFAFVAVEQGRRASGLLAAAASACIVPWLIRDWFLTGSPVAPFLNLWFPSGASTPALERHLFDMYNAFRPGISWRAALPAYTVTGGNQGLLGPAFLALPLALVALYRKRGRWLAGCSLVLTIPFLADTGTRFLLPALVPASLALTSILPVPVLTAVIAVQAIGSLPSALDLYEERGEWRIRDVPVKAALRLTPEPDYLVRTLPGISTGRAIARSTPADSKIFVCTPLPESYIPRELLFYWQSRQADRFTGALHFASISHDTPADLFSPGHGPLRLAAQSEFRVVEGAGGRSRWQPVEVGQSIQLRGAVLIWPSGAARADKQVWLAQRHIDLRRDATAYIRRSGYRYILIPVTGGPFAPIGADMARHPAEWGVEEAARAGNSWLFHIRPDLF